MSQLTVVILTYNEAKHIGRCLDAISGIAEKVFVIDSGSNDDTVAIATQAGAVVLTNPFVNQAQQFQWGMDNAPITTEWVMRLDADEVVSPELAAEISRRLPQLPVGVNGVNLRRRHVFLGRWVRHGGRYPLILLRIWRRGTARVEQRWMDEHIFLTEGRAVTFDADFEDRNLNDLTHFTDKHNKYATREAVDVINKRRALFPQDSHLTADKTSGKAAFTRLVKERVYNRIPFQFSALAYFLYRYVLQLGFLDGREGAVYHVLQGFWYRYLVGAKVLELETALQGLDNEVALLELTRLTGLRLKD